MATKFVYEVIINSVERINNSKDGNPRYVLKTTKGDYKTKENAHLGYMIENMTHGSLGSEPWVIGNPENPTVDLICNENDEVWGIEYAGKAYP